MLVSCDQWRTSIVSVQTMANKKQTIHGWRAWLWGHMGVLRLYKVKNFGWNQLLLAVLTPDYSFVCINSFQLLSCTTQASLSKNKYIRFSFYTCSLLFVNIQWLYMTKEMAGKMLRHFRMRLQHSKLILFKEGFSIFKLRSSRIWSFVCFFFV